MKLLHYEICAELEEELVIMAVTMCSNKTQLNYQSF